MKDIVNFDLYEEMLTEKVNSEKETQSAEYDSPSPIKLVQDQINLGPWSKAVLAQYEKLKLTRDDPNLRRSARRKNINKGYKDPTYSEKDCIACSIKPPSISATVIKNLGATFL